MCLKDYQFLSDIELYELIRQDDQSAFACLYKRYSSDLYYSAYNLLRDKYVCEDILQDLFSHLWNKRTSLEIRSFRSYLYTATRNRVLMAIRAGRAHLDLSVAEELADRYGTDSKLLENEANQFLNNGISILPEKCREIFYLSRKEQLTNKEIAERLNISSKTVENQITIALRRLRSVLGDFLFLAACLFLFF